MAYKFVVIFGEVIVEYQVKHSRVDLRKVLILHVDIVYSF